MEIRFIKPKRTLLNAAAVFSALHAEMTRFIIKTHETFRNYPPVQPTVSGYIRSKALGHSWHYSVVGRPSLIVGKVGSDPTVQMRTPHYRRLKSGKRSRPFFPKSPYVGFVMGKRQTREMKGRGWKKVADYLKKEWPGQVRKFQQAINQAK